MLYSRYRDSKNRLAYNEFAYKKTKDYCKLEHRFQKKVISGSHISKIADKQGVPVFPIINMIFTNYNFRRSYTSYYIGPILLSQKAFGRLSHSKSGNFSKS